MGWGSMELALRASGVGKTSGRLKQQRKPDGVVDVLLAREQRGRADKATGWAKQCSAWK